MARTPDPFEPFRPADPRPVDPEGSSGPGDPLDLLRGDRSGDRGRPAPPPASVSGHALAEGWRGAAEAFRGRLGAGRSSAIAAVVVVLALAAGWWWVSAAERTPGGGPGAFVAGGTTIPFAGSTTTEPIEPEPHDDADDIVVHAAGAVVAPGIYQLAGSARISDLLAAAGGVGPTADLDRLNLAEPLSDGVRLYVPSIGEDEPPALTHVDGPSGRGGGGLGTSGGGAGATAVSVIDLNRATIDELVSLPGVGPTTAAAIVSHRDANGPFRSVEGLIEVRGIGPAKLDQIRPLVRT